MWVWSVHNSRLLWMTRNTTAINIVVWAALILYRSTRTAAYSMSCKKAHVQVIPVLWLFPLRDFCSTVVVVAFACRTNVLWPVTTDVFSQTMNLNKPTTSTVHYINWCGTISGVHVHVSQGGAETLPFDSTLSQQHLCQKSFDVRWSYSVQHQCRFFETQCTYTLSTTNM